VKSNTTYGDDNDDGDGEIPRSGTQKLLSQCEASEIDALSNANFKKKRVSFPGRADIATDPSLRKEKPNASLMSETSFFKMLGYAKSWVVGSTDVDTSVAEHKESGADYQPTPLSTKTDLSLVSPIKIKTPKIVLHASHVEDEDAHPEADKFMAPSRNDQEPRRDAYFTEYGDPEITPVARITTRSQQQTLKSLLLAPQLSPRQQVQQRLRSHSFSNRISVKKYRRKMSQTRILTLMI
jgi:hypothetical protein